MKYIKYISTFFVFIVIGFLLIVVYSKNRKIENLKIKLEEKPKIEYVYTHTVDTIRDSIIVPKKVVSYHTKIIRDTTYLPSEINWDDSVAIAKSYSKLYESYSNIKKYDDVLKDDSTAFIRLQEDVQYNSIFNRNLIYQDRTPIIHVTKTVKIDNIRKSFVVGLGVKSGLEDNVIVGAGWITKRNMFYTVGYSPINKEIFGAVYVPVFNFK